MARNRDTAKHSAWNLAKYHRVRAEAIARLGGKCIDCGTTDSLQFDHADASTKQFDMSKIIDYSAEKRDAELAKCVLRCPPCHIAKTKRAGENTGGGWNKLPDGAYRHGTERMYNYRACKCAACKAAHSLYVKHLIAVDEVVGPDDAGHLRALQPAKGTHGTNSAYRWCGPPKCEACRAAHREAVYLWRDRKREQG